MPKKTKKFRKEKKAAVQRRKFCRFCADKELTIDYKLAKHLSYFLTERAKIVPRRINGNCAFHQRRIVEAVNRARVLALLPATITHANI